MAILLRPNRWLNLEMLLYLLPLSLLMGTNLPFLESGGRAIAIGTTELILLALAVGLLYRHVALGQPIVLPRLPTVAVTAFTVAILASIVADSLFYQQPPALDVMIELVRWFEYLLVLLCLFMLARTERQIRLLLFLTLVGVASNMAAGLYQAATLDFSAARIYGLFVSAANRDAVSVSNPNVIGTLFMGGSLYCLAFGLNPGVPRRSWLLALVAPLLIVMLLTLSRSAMLGFMLGVLVLSFYYRNNRLFFTALGIIAIAGVGAVIASEDLTRRLLNTISQQEGTTATISTQSRLEGWAGSFEYITAHPWFGIGFRNVAHRTPFTTLDNYYLEILLSTGLVGLVCLSAMLWILFVPMLRLPARPQTYGYSLKAGFVSTYVAFLLVNVFAGMFFNPRLLGLFWWLVGISLMWMRLEKRQARLEAPSNAP